MTQPHPSLATVVAMPYGAGSAESPAFYAASPVAPTTAMSPNVAASPSVGASAPTLANRRELEPFTDRTQRARALEPSDASSTWAGSKPARTNRWAIYAALVVGGAGVGVAATLVLGQRPTVADPPVTPEPAPIAQASATTPAPTEPPKPASIPEPIADPPTEPEPSAVIPEEPAPPRESPTTSSSSRARKRESSSTAPKAPVRDDDAAPSSSAGASEPDLAVAELAAKGNAAFNAGQYGQAAKYLERAVRKAPQEASYRISLGDAYFKQARYNAAKTHYSKAAELGHPAAERRLDKVAKAESE